MVLIAICDDEITIGAELERTLMEVFAQQKVECEIDVFFAGDDLCRKMEAGAHYDLIFLDIEFAENETNGVEYTFLSHDLFQKMIENDEFLEYAKYVGEFYGTPIKPIIDNINSGNNIILDIEVQGAKQVMAKDIDAVTIFIEAPDMAELEKRLRGRGTDSDEKIHARLERARQEIEEKIHYDYVVVNDNALRAAKEILEIIEK